MNRLIKAESFRLRKHVFFVIVCAILLGLIPTVSALNVDLRNANLEIQIKQSSMIIMFFMMIFPAVFAGVTGTLYDGGKIGFYEIMAGNKARSIIFSKILTDGLFFLLLTVVSTCGYYTYVGFCKGVGNLDHMAVRVLLIILVLAHVVFCSVLVTLCFKQVKTGMIMSFMRFWLVDILFFPFLMWLFGTVLNMPSLAMHFSYMCLTNQLMILVSEPMHAMITWHVLLGFAAEFALWYFIIYLEFRKRKIA